MLFQILLISLISVSQGEVQFSHAVVMGRVSSGKVDENSGLAASRRHPGIVYGHNDHGDSNRIFAMDPTTGELVAELNIGGVHNNDWEDICVGTCADGTSNTCIYIGDIGEENGNDARKVYKVREPAVLRDDDTLPVEDILRFRWNEDDAESLMIDPSGDLYVISKVSGGNGLFAKLPSSGWGSSQGVYIDSSHTVHLNLDTDHLDPQAGDLSPDGLSLLVKTEENVYYYSFSSIGDYVRQLAGARAVEVSYYERRNSGESVAWTVNGDGFFTLPEGSHPVFNFYFVHEVNVIG